MHRNDQNANISHFFVLRDRFHKRVLFLEMALSIIIIFFRMYRVLGILDQKKKAILDLLANSEFHSIGY